MHILCVYIKRKAVKTRLKRVQIWKWCLCTLNVCVCVLLFLMQTLLLKKCRRSVRWLHVCNKININKVSFLYYKLGFVYTICCTATGQKCIRNGKNINKSNACSWYLVEQLICETLYSVCNIHASWAAPFAFYFILLFQIFLTATGKL